MTFDRTDKSVGDARETAIRPEMNATRAGEKFLFIEGMRGVLALLVCTGHLGLNTVVGAFGFNVNFGLAVDVFFVLSGFVLSKSYYLGRCSFAELFKKRVARLYPLHLLTLIFVAGLMIVKGESVNYVDFFQNVTLIHGLGLPRHMEFNFPSWSISVEMVLSLVFYFIIRSDNLASCVALAAAGLASSIIAARLDAATAAVPRGCAGFCLGAASYMIGRRFDLALAAARLLQTPLLIALTLLFFLDPKNPAVGPLIYSAAPLFLWICVVRAETSLFSHPVLVHLGEISYSIYLLHVPILLALLYILPESIVRGAGKPAVVALVIAASVGCRRHIEIPTQRWVLRLRWPAPSRSSK
jgi:peptidoglycan/LPS O-acetylase OafA/YrhL